MNNSFSYVILSALAVCSLLQPSIAHEGHVHSSSSKTHQKIEHLNTAPQAMHFVTQKATVEGTKPTLAILFSAFGHKVNVHFDSEFLYVESNGMPEHPMMTGIRAWQQQVPLPQPYTGDNAWRIPLHPVRAKVPMLTKSHFFRGAIALAVNGVPIFNPIKNDGKTDTLLAGELDQWGGHCGRADDYHYHIAPVHLEKFVGAGNPIAVALDGYPIYGFHEKDGKQPTNLDELNGHEGPDGTYHYHATKTFPYLNGGFYGEVVERDGQVDPQPRAQGVRPHLPGLKGATIVGFEKQRANSYTVKYEVFGKPRSVRYSIGDNGTVTFAFVSEQGTTTETYSARRRSEGGGRYGTEATPIKKQRGNKKQEERWTSNDPISMALDVNGDGKIDGSELRRIGVVLREFDSDRDGLIAVDEIRKSEHVDNEPQGGGGVRGPQSDNGPRQPWILVHATEIDLDKNGMISRNELVGEAVHAFKGYDKNNDGQLNDGELGVRGGSRSAMGGFIKGHAKEIDRDGDGVVSRDEVVNNAERMFSKIDDNSDDVITPEELEASRRQ